jgi:hypothetical protein
MSFKASLPFHEVREGFAASERDPNGPATANGTFKNLKWYLFANCLFSYSVFQEIFDKATPV